MGRLVSDGANNLRNGLNVVGEYGKNIQDFVKSEGGKKLLESLGLTGVATITATALPYFLAGLGIWGVISAHKDRKDASDHAEIAKATREAVERVRREQMRGLALQQHSLNALTGLVEEMLRAQRVRAELRGVPQSAPMGAGNVVEDFRKIRDENPVLAAWLQQRLEAEFTSSPQDYGLRPEDAGAVQAEFAAIRQELEATAKVVAQTREDAEVVAPVMADLRQAVQGMRRPLAVKAPPGHALSVLPHRGSPAFVETPGRLERVHRWLNEGDDPVVLGSTGGMGKTETAIQYVTRHREEYSRVVWLAADGLLNLQNSAAAYVEGDGKPDEKTAHLWDALARETGWLAVFDNVNGEAWTREFADSIQSLRGCGHLLVTSQGNEAAWGDGFRCEPMEKLDEAQSVELIRRIFRPADPWRPEEDAAAVWFAREFDGLPLGLDQIARYAQEYRPKALVKAREDYERDPGGRLAERGEARGHANALLRTVELQLDALRSAHPDAAAVVERCSVMAPEGIPLGAVSEQDPPRDAHRAARTSLIQLDEARAHASMHRLVQTCVRKAIGPDREDAAASEAAAGLLRDRPVVWWEWDSWLPKVPHWETLRHRGGREARHQEFGFWLGTAMIRLGLYEQAETELRKTFQTLHTVLGFGDPLTLASRNALCIVLVMLGRYEEAEWELRETIQLSSETSGAGHPSTLASRNALGDVLDSLGRYDEAETELRNVFWLKTETLGPDHPSTLTTRHAFGNVLISLGRYGEAEAELRETIRLKGEVLGLGHPETLASRHSRGIVLARLRRHDEAAYEFLAVMDGNECKYETMHPVSLQTRAALLHLRQRQMAWAEIEALIAPLDWAKLREYRDTGIIPRQATFLLGFSPEGE